MRIYKRIAALAFVLVLLLSCFPAAAFASGEQDVTEPEGTAAPTDAPPIAVNAPAPRIGGSIGGSTGDASIGGTKPGSGSLAYMAPGVTMQVIYFRYKDVYDKQTTYDRVVAGADSPVKTYKAMNSAGEPVDTVLSGTLVSNYTVFGDLNNGYPVQARRKEMASVHDPLYLDEREKRRKRTAAKDIYAPRCPLPKCTESRAGAAVLCRKQPRGHCVAGGL